MNTFLIIMGFLIVGLVSAVMVLIFAPRSGKETRNKIRNKSTELHDSTSDFVNDSLLQARSIANVGSEKFEEIKQKGLDLASEKLDNLSKTTKEIKNDGSEKLKEIKQQGQDLASEKLDNLSKTAEDIKNEIQKP